MNCRPGDVAITVHPSLTTLVAVLQAAPNSEFVLPNGITHVPPEPGAGPRWVCEALGAPLRAPVEGGGSRLTRYAVFSDCWLRPIRDNDGEDEMLRIAGKPREKVEG